jgi:hypothetical protein
VANRHGVNVSIDQYCQRFPQQHALVQQFAQRSSERTKSLSVHGRPVGALEVGDTIGDFDLLALLGQGTFAKVFLAQQRSLQRQVALKVSANFGGEARTMASLEHDYIVQVFSEEVLADRNLRMLCMQYVPGATLGQVIDWLAQHKPNGFGPPGEQADRAARLRALADERRRGAPSARCRRPEVSVALDRIIRHCLAPEPEQRFASAEQLAAHLDGARRLQTIRGERRDANCGEAACD